MIGGLHIEMAILSAIVDWVQESGWTAVINTANVTTEGRADNLLRGYDTAQAQWAHQLCALKPIHPSKSHIEEELSFTYWCKHFIHSSTIGTKLSV